MSNSDDKYKMFKNFMHNELGISKGDIHEWVKEAIKEEVKKVVNNSYGHINIESEIRKTIRENSYWQKYDLDHSIKKMTAEILANRMDIKIIP